MLNRSLISGLVICMLGTANVYADESEMLYELRTYTANEGKLSALHARFRNHTMALFEKHGMKNIGYWVPVDKADTLTYLIAHKNQESVAASWKAFVADPDWQKVYADSIVDGALVNNIDSTFMRATDYSPGG